MLPTVNTKEKSIDSVLLTSVPGNLDRIVESMKPGSHLLLFSNVKDHHAGTIAAEDAGLEIRDTVAYVFAEGENDVGMMLVTVARKPLDGTVAENVLKWGTGGLNIDLCRIKTPVGVKHATNGKGDVGGGGVYGGYRGGWSCESPSQESVRHNSLGRWPANLLHDNSPNIVAMFPTSKSSHPTTTKRSPDSGNRTGYGTFLGQLDVVIGYGDGGSAARYFYAAPSIDNLIAYLLKLVTPPNGTVLTNHGIQNLPEEYSYVTNREY